MGRDGPRYHRLDWTVQGAETRRLPFRRKPRDSLEGRWHSGGIDAAELGGHEKSAARGWIDLGAEAENGGEHGEFCGCRANVAPKVNKRFWRKLELLGDQKVVQSVVHGAIRLNLLILAERGGFEPPVHVLAHTTV